MVSCILAVTSVASMYLKILLFLSPFLEESPLKRSLSVVNMLFQLRSSLARWYAHGNLQTALYFENSFFFL